MHAGRTAAGWSDALRRALRLARRAGALVLPLLLSGCMWLDFWTSLRRGRLLYRMEYRPERVCVPVENTPRAREACVRALWLLGGGTIEIPGRRIRGETK